MFLEVCWFFFWILDRVIYGILNELINGFLNEFICEVLNGILNGKCILEWFLNWRIFIKCVVGLLVFKVVINEDGLVKKIS